MLWNRLRPPRLLPPGNSSHTTNSDRMAKKKAANSKLFSSISHWPESITNIIWNPVINRVYITLGGDLVP